MIGVNDSMAIYYVGSMPYSDELFHHGIKGQKWGIRRYQNADGTLTPEGVKRYGTVENFQKAQQDKAKRGLSDDTKRKIKTAAKVAGIAALTGAAAYGAYKVGKGIQKGHENYVDRMTMHKLSNEMNTRDLFVKQLDFNDRMEMYANPYASKNANIQSINNIFNRKVASIIQEGEALKTGASFVKRISNARKWAKFGKYA